MTIDPLLQPNQRKLLRPKNRVMTSAHEPAYSEDGLPKDRYRLYCPKERCKLPRSGGVERAGRLAQWLDQLIAVYG